MATVRRVLASVLAWVLGAAAAVGIGLLALSLIGDGLSTVTGQPLTPDAIARESASAPAIPAPSASPPPSPETLPRDGPTPGEDSRGAPPSAGPPGAGRPGATPSRAPDPQEPGASQPAAVRPAERTFTTSGGAATVRCTGSEAYLVSWSPRDGYRYDNVDRGPGDRVRVRFRSDDNKVDVRATCAGGVPQPRIDED